MQFTILTSMKSTLSILFLSIGVAGALECDRPWPKIDLFLPACVYKPKHKRLYELDSLFLRPFQLFWPLKASNVSLVVAYDAEQNASSHAVIITNTIRDLNSFMPGGAKVALLPPSPYYRDGYDRQQLAMFWADNFTTSEYIGFMDTDATMVTFVDREDLFEDSKPIVNGRGGRALFDHTWVWAAGTFETLGILEPFKSMSYFPVIIKRSHLKDLRDFIADRHNLTFDDAFYRNISAPGTGRIKYFSQFDIMFAYLFTFKRNEYKWYIQSESPDWDGKNPPPVYGQDGNVSQFTAEMLVPKPRIATHARYRNSKHISGLVSK